MSEPSIRYNRFEGHSLADKHGWTQQGPGAAELEKARAALAGFGGDLAVSEQMLRDAVRQLGGEWEGTAAERAGATMVAAAAWAGDSGGMTSQAGSTVEQQGTVVGDTRSKVPQPPDTSYGFGDAMKDGAKTLFNAQTLGVFGVQTDAQQKIEAYRKADSAANTALYAYESTSRAHADAMPPLEQPPPITVDTAAPAAPPPPPPAHGGADQPPPRSGGGGSTGAQGTDLPGGHTPSSPHTGGTPTSTGGGSTSTSDTGQQPPSIVRALGGGDDHARQDGSHGADLVAGGLGLGAGVIAGGFTLGDGMRGAGRGIGGGSLGDLLGEGEAGSGSGSGGGKNGTAGRGAASGLGPLNTEEAEARAVARGATGTGRAGGAGAMGPAVAGGGRGRGEDDGEHTDRYAVDSDDVYVDDMPRVAPPVIGEDPPA
jgi:hypothetical protein